MERDAQHHLKEPVSGADMSVMAPRRILNRLRALSGGESGMALPTALFAMIASLALASAAVMSSIDVQQGSTIDHNAKEAIAAADAGANVALLRLNRFNNSLSTTKPCIGPAGETQVAVEGWCPSTPVETVGGSTFTYRVSAYSATGGILNVVAVGTAGTVSRRVEVSLYSESGQNVFAEEKLIGQDGIDVSGNAEVEAGIGTNGNITGNGSYKVCGDQRHGTGKKSELNPSCGGKVTEGNKELPPVSAPSDITTNNSNCRLAANCTVKSEVDTYQKNGKENRSSSAPWEASSSTINISSQSTLTMGGRDYLVCKINVQNGELIMAAGATIRIFVKKPQECGMSSGATQIELNGGTFSSTNFSTTHQVPGIYMLGDGAVSIKGNPGTQNDFILYAPESAITISGNATWVGMIAGKTLNIGGGAIFKADPNIQPPNYTLSSLLRRTRYVECTGTTTSAPDTSC